MTTDRDPPPERAIVPTPGGPSESRTDQFAVWYSDRYGLRAAIALIPTLGGAIDSLVGGRGAQIGNQRVMHLIEALQLDMGRVDAEKVDRTYLESEAFHDLIRRAFESCTRMRDRGRIEAVAKVLVGAVTGKSHMEPDAILDILADMTEGEATVLRAIWQHNLASKTTLRLGDPVLGTNLPEDLSANLRAYLGRLSGRGLVNLNSGGFGGGTTIETTATTNILFHYLGQNPMMPVDS